MNDSTDLDSACINTIRTLSMDAVQAANSGHPGTPMAMAPVAYCLWQQFLRFDPDDPIWPNRDRFVLSVGHASMLLYSLLHLTGVKAVRPGVRNAGRAVASPLEDDQAFPPARQQVPRPSRSTAGPAASRPPPARSGRAWPPASAWPSAARWMAAHFNQPGFETVRLQRLRPVRRRLHDGGRLRRGRLAGRPPQARQPVLDLRQQPHHHRRQHRAGLQRGRGHALPRLRLERHARRRRQRSGDAGAGLPNLPEHARTGRR